MCTQYSTSMPTGAPTQQGHLEITMNDPIPREGTNPWLDESLGKGGQPARELINPHIYSP